MAQVNNNSPASKEMIARELEIVRDSFAPRSNEFFKAMVGVMLEEGYTIRQVRGGIKDVIRTCGYNQLAISTMITACNNQFPRYSEWEITTLGEIRRSTYDQFKADQNRYGKENVKFIRDME